jgi:hypothetical protein
VSPVAERLRGALGRAVSHHHNAPITDSIPRWATHDPLQVFRVIEVLHMCVEGADKALATDLASLW